MDSFMPGIEIDPDAVEQQANNLDQQLQDNAAEVEASKQQEEETAKANEQEQAQLEDPRSDGKVGFNLPDIAAETKAAVTGGFQDTASSLVTLPERFGDMFNGEMEAAGDNYKPGWDPTGADGENKIVTETWWGGFLRGAIHFGTMAVGTVVAAKGVAAVGAAAGVSTGAA